MINNLSKKGIGVIFLLFGIILIIRDWLINFSNYQFIDIGIGFPINVFLLNVFLGFLFMLIGIVLLSISHENFEDTKRVELGKS